MSRISVLHVCAALWLALSLEPLSSQTTTGSIVGTVSDNSGAAVPGASVTVTNIDTNIATKTSTDSAGQYVLTPLPVGHYSVAVEAQAFKRSVSAGLTLNVQYHTGVNAALAVGQPTEAVDVTAS